MKTTDTTKRVVNVLSYGILIAMTALICYWIITNSLEDIETIFIAIFLSALMGANIVLSNRGRTRLAAWLVIGLMLILNAANIIWYGIGTTSTAALLIPIVAAFIGLGVIAGGIVTGISLAVVWGTVLAQSAGQLLTEIPYQVSNLTFDAPMLTILFVFVAVLTAQAKR
ncbi:MAG: hypothetical protein HYZ25_10540 [Chloroflexi bacterium]|nr:hypothetical protein [Chloroflexota bacterium]